MNALRDPLQTPGAVVDGVHTCHDGQQCLTHELWDDLSQQIYDFLDDISLQDLMEERSIQQVAQRQDLRIREDDSQPDALSSDVSLTDDLIPSP